MTEEKDMDNVPESSENESSENESSQQQQTPEGDQSQAAGAEQAADKVAEEVAVAADDEAAESSDEASAEENKVVNPDDASEGDAEAEMMAMLDELPDENSNATPDDIDFGSAKVSNAEFQHLSESSEKPEPRNIDLLMDVNLPVSIELGKTKMTISDILALGPGSVVELSKLAGEPVDVLVNNNAVARGEVVVIDENFGVRITQLMTAEERLRSIADEK